MASVARREWTHKGETKTAWVVRYVDRGGVHRSRQYEKKKEADRYKTKIEGEMLNGVSSADAENMTVKAVATDFMLGMEHRQRDGRIGKAHVKRLSVFIYKYVIPRIGNYRLADLNLARLTAWHRDMVGPGQLSPNTARCAVQALKMVYDHAIRREWTGRNLAAPLLAELRGLRRKPIRTFTVEEMRRLLTATGMPMYVGRRPRANLMMQCAVHLATFCGLRVGEITGMQTDSIDFVGRSIRIKSSLSRYDGLKGPKTAAGNRDVGLPRHVAELIQTWIRHFAVPNEAGLLFTHADGRPISADVFRRSQWASLLRRAGLGEAGKPPAFHFHALRHFAASWRVDAGWGLADVARQLGHSKFDMTLGTYTHALAQDGAMTDASQELSDRLIASPILALPSPIAQELRNAE